MGFRDQGLAVAYGLPSVENKYKIVCVEFFPEVTEDTLTATLATFVKKHHLEGAATFWVLAPDAYKAIQIEEPKVPDEEMALAARWQLKDLVDYPIELAAIDIYKIPPHGPGNTRKRVVAVVCPLEYLQKGVAAIHAAGLNVNVIDVSELALRNVSAFYPNDKGVAILSLSKENSEVLMTRDGNLYFSRRFHLDYEVLVQALSRDGHRDDSTKKIIDSLILEITRTYDYFTSQLSLPAPACLLLPPIVPHRSAITAQLSELFSNEVHILDLTKLVQCQAQFEPTLQMQCLPIVSSLFREQDIGHATTN